MPSSKDLRVRRRRQSFRQHADRPQGTVLSALAIYDLKSTSGSREISTLQFPKIPKSEWPQILEEIVTDVVENKSGEIYEHLKPRQIAGLDAAARKVAVAAITRHIEELGKLKTVIGQ